MRWRSVAIAGVLWPAAAGCNIAHNAARNIVNEPHVVWTQHAIKHELRSSAQAAFELARGECPEHADSAEFRDGFIDGYIDYLDRGGNGSLPAVPPAKYTRHKWYYTEEGQCRLKEYFLGFKLGLDTAIASGRRQELTVPVLLPQEPPVPTPFNVVPGESTPIMPPPRPPAGVAQSAATPAPPVAAATTAEPVVVRNATKTAPSGEFHPLMKPRMSAIPAVISTMPVTHSLGAPPLPLPAQAGPSGPRAWGDLPAIPAIAPTPDAAPVPTPQLPEARTEPAAAGVLPPNHTLPPPLPPNHPQPRE